MNRPETLFLLLTFLVVSGLAYGLIRQLAPANERIEVLDQGAVTSLERAATVCGWSSGAISRNRPGWPRRSPPPRPKNKRVFRGARLGAPG